jgi:hypothetical protein
MEQYVFYDTTNGKIFYVKKIRSDAKADEIVGNNSSFSMAYKKLSEVSGVFASERSQKIDVSTDPISFVKRSSPLMKPFSEEIKEQRNARLLASDWTQGADSPLSDSKKAEWQTYRQALRDISYSDLNHGDTVTWPTQPS